jgi:multiple sugar transport system ATP-binding protein
MAQVLLEKVSKIYDGGVEAVKNADLNIKDREFMVIVGPSGCGKSTTLRMIAGLEDVTMGKLSIADRVVNDIPPKDRDIAMVFQNYALYPHMTVFQNMAFGLKLRKYPKEEIQKRVNQAADMLGINELLKRKPKALSGGQRQRVALGRAIVRNPKAFLFDEPLSNLDAKLRVTTRAELKALHQRLQTTSIYVTHDQAEAMTLGDRICVMYNGEIQQVDAPMKVYDHPVNRFVAGFLGTPPMNFFDGKIEFKDGRCSFVSPSGSVGIPDTIKIGKEYDGKSVTLGIRPEHIYCDPDKSSHLSPIKAAAKVIEPLGDRKDVYFDTTASVRFIANLDPYTKVSVNETIDVYFDTARIHLFEPGETGKNITLTNMV